MALAREHHYAWKNLAGGHFSEKRENPRYEGNAAHDVNNRPTTTEGFHPGPTSISRSSVTWSKTTPISSETKRNNGGRREEKKNKEREREKKGKEREKATRSIVSRCQNNVDPFRRKNTPLVECKGWNNFSRTKKEEGGWNIARKLLFALEIIS